MDIERLKELAGVNEYKGYTPYTLENISKTASEKRKIEREKRLSQATMTGSNFGLVYHTWLVVVLEDVKNEIS